MQPRYTTVPSDLRLLMLEGAIDTYVQGLIRSERPSRKITFCASFSPIVVHDLPVHQGVSAEVKYTESHNAQ